MGLEGFRHARAAAARMCAAWYYLTGMVPRAGARRLLNEFDVRAKVAREGHFDKNHKNKKHCLFLRFGKNARADCKFCWVRKSYVSYVFKINIYVITTPIRIVLEVCLPLAPTRQTPHALNVATVTK